MSCVFVVFGLRTGGLERSIGGRFVLDDLRNLTIGFWVGG
jgi:hypothetical protein